MRKSLILFALLTLSVGMWAQTELNPLPTPASDQIVYRSADHQIITPNKTNVFGANIISNEYDTVADMGTITFSGNVTTIGEYAFNDRTNLISMVCPSTVTSIGKRAFHGCTNLSSVALQEGLISIGTHAFNGCSALKNVTIPNTLEDIGEASFNVCISLVEITVPSTVKNFGNSAFSGCTGLESVTVEINTISAGAFQNCTNLSFVDLQEGVISIGNNAFSGCSALKKVTIPSTTKTIGESAFNSCAGLTVLNVKAGSIGNYAFGDCTSLDSVTLGHGVTSIGNRAFGACSHLTSVTFLESFILPGELFENVGTTQSPVTIKLPSLWPVNDRPVNSTIRWHGGYFTGEYVDPVKEFLGEMGEPCTDCHAVEVTKGDKSVKLYQPDKVEFIMESEAE